MNFQTSQGKTILKSLAQKCDILVENFVPGKLKKLGLDYESLGKVWSKDNIFWSKAFLEDILLQKKIFFTEFCEKTKFCRNKSQFKLVKKQSFENLHRIFWNILTINFLKDGA